MAQGQLIPYLALALQIQSKFGYNVTIVNTPLNIQTLQQLLPPNKTSTINLVELPFIPHFPQKIKIRRSQLSNLQIQATGNDTWSLFLKTVLSQTLNSDGFLINKIEDFDQLGLSYFKSKLGQTSVWAVALSESKVTKTSSDIIQWLENHENNTISRSQIMELAIGIEKSDKNFIWVIRPPLGFDINGEFRSEWLPEGFEGRMKEKNKGLLVRKWTPQLEILSHKCTSAFLSHCGWNSVLESLSFGVPIIGWPLAADQLSNSKLLEEEMGICVELAKGNRNEVKHEDVVRVIDLVMNEKELEMRKKAFKVKEMIKNVIREDEGLEGSSVKGIKEFFAAVLSRKKEMKMDHHGNNLNTTSFGV
ncbi:hypothetical protein MKX01_030973 [Papaver californicum]|nr:hypothetical protein MKX01_030973 [Papaver californicum]